MPFKSCCLPIQTGSGLICLHRRPNPARRISIMMAWCLRRGDARSMKSLGLIRWMEARVNGAGSHSKTYLRNGSAELPGPRLISWIDNLGTRFLPDRARPSLLLASLVDAPGSQDLYPATAGHLFRTFWARFGWGHVPLNGAYSYQVLFIITLLALGGALLGVFMCWKALALGCNRHAGSGCFANRVAGADPRRCISGCGRLLFSLRSLYLSGGYPVVAVVCLRLARDIPADPSGLAQSRAQAGGCLERPTPGSSPDWI